MDSCILWAAEKGRLGTLKLSHRYGASLDTNGTRNDDDLHLPWQQIPGRRRFFVTPLHLAFQHSHMDIIEYLLESGASPHIPARSFTSDKLYYVLDDVWGGIRSKRDGDAEMLIRHGANLLAKDVPALPYFAGQGGDSKLLCVFLEQNDPEVTAQALRSGAQYQIPDLFFAALEKPELNASTPDPANGKTALHYAVTSGGASIVGKTIFEALITRGDIDVTARDHEGRMPIHAAAATGVPHIVNTLLKHPDVNLSTADKTGRNPLHYLCNASGDTPSMRGIAEQILEADITSVNQVSPKGTPLFLAVKNQNLELALYLLSKGADPSLGPTADDFNWNMLHHLLYEQDRIDLRTKLVREIVARGNIDLEADADDTPEDVEFDDRWMYLGPPLYFAAAHAQSIECMKIILDVGADPSSGPVVVGRDPADNVEWGDIHAALNALFESLPCQTDDEIANIRERVCLLLDRGYSLDGGGTGTSAGCPLQWVTLRERIKLCKLILDNSTAKNISFGHLMQHIRDLPGGEDDKATEFEKEARTLLAEFRNREFADLESGGEDDHWVVEGDEDETDSDSGEEEE